MRASARLWAVLLALAAVACGVARADQLGPEPGRGMFDPPASPMILTRELRRSLSDGKEIVTRRSYEIHFVTEPGGYRVDGRLLSVDVSVPPRLQALGELERIRSDEGLFPMHVTSRGMIVDQQVQATMGAPQTRHLAESMIARSPLPSNERSGALGFIAAILAHPEIAGGHWPAELFHPLTGTRSDANTYTLPDGGAGRMTITIDAKGDGPGGTLQFFERTIVTEAGSTPQISHESWTLVPAAK